MPFNPFETPISSSDKPAGSVVSFPRPRGAKFKKAVTFTIKIARWVAIMLNLADSSRRQQLAADEILLDEYQMKNLYLSDGLLMFKGQRYIQVNTFEMRKVMQSVFDLKTKVQVICAYLCAW